MITNSWVPFGENRVICSKSYTREGVSRNSFYTKYKIPMCCNVELSAMVIIMMMRNNLLLIIVNLRAWPFFSVFGYNNDDIRERERSARYVKANVIFCILH